MNNPPPESHPAPGSFASASSKLQHDVVLEDLRRSLAKFPELKPLLRVLDPNVHEQPNEGHDAFASMFKSFCQQKHFEKQFKADVPDQMMKLIETYAATRPGADTRDHKSAVFSDPNVLANLASAHALSSGPVLKSKSVMSALSDLASHFNGTTAPREAPPETPLPPLPIPLPPSPQFHHFATQIFKNQKPFPDVMEGDGKPMNRVAGMEFENWGLTVKNTPSDTFIARTEVGLSNLVKWAGAQQPKKKIRVAGYRHTWSDFYSSENEVLVMLLPIKILTDIPAYEMTIQEAQKDSDLVGIEVADAPLGMSQNATSTLCTIKAGTTNEMFRRWCLDRRSWCLPFNVIMVEITFGGSNGPICHGSGFKTTTLSDLVAEFHYIDPSGNPKSISDPAQLRAASGCFGLLGICTAVTLRLEAMTMAVMNPVKLPLPLAIPPPPGFKIPSAIDMSGIDEKQLEQARKDFIKRCEEDDYLEWFWFPLTKKVWVNTWKKQDAASTASLDPYPSGFDALLQWTEGWLAEKTVTSWPFQLLSPRKQALLMGTIALSQMPDLPDPKDTIKTLFSEAIHFRRGIQNMRCLDSEWEIPIPESANSPGKRDYQKVQQAWWDAIAVFYEREDVPMRLTLEMRLTGGSNVILAPQRGNNFGTISIEVLTTLNTPKDEWQSFLQQLVNKWTNYSDHKGERLMARPHWAKQWEGLMVDGQPIETYLKQTAYKQAIPEFRKALETIAQAQGTSVDAMRERFGNHLLEELFFAS